MELKKGFTLVETLVSVSILGAVSLGVLKTTMDNTKTETTSNFIEEAVSIVSAIDKRISIDGYDPLLWGKTSWANQEEIITDLIDKRLTSKHSTVCSGGLWEPQVATEEKAKLIQCGLWKGKIHDEFEIKAHMGSDSSGYIQRFEMQISFKDQESLKNNYQDLKKSVFKLKTVTDASITGSYIYDFISASTGDSVTTSECITNVSDCRLSLSLERSGGAEYIRSDGGNSMIGDHLTFIETKGDSPLKCVRWKNTQKDGSGAWTMSTVTEEDCGVGVYKDLGHPAVVDLVAHNGTFKNILLNKNCNVYRQAGSSVVVNGTSPCGIIDDGNIVQVVDNIHTNLVFAEEAVFNILNTKKLVSSEIDAVTMEITGLAKLSSVDSADTLTVGGVSDFNGGLTVTEKVFIEGGLNIIKETQIGNKFEADEDVVATTRMAAPIGDFGNINAEIAQLKDSYNSLNNDLRSPWLVGGWGSCSASCGGGTQTRTIYCPTGKVCYGTVPSSTQSCNTQACWDPNRGDNGGSGNGSDSGHE